MQEPNLLPGLRPALILLIMMMMMATRGILAAPLNEQTTEIEYYPVADSTGCYYNFQHYDEADRIITNEPCLNCTCHNKMLMCYLRVCPFTKAIGQDCRVEKRPDQCCPVITCPEVPVQLLTSTTQSSTEVGHLDAYGCSIEGLFYTDGARVPSDPNKPCELCYCIRNKTACVMQECTLKIEGCKPVYQEGVCCPARYDCEHPDYNLLETTARPLLTTTTTQSPTTTTLGPVDCVFNGEIYADGALITKEKPCEHCYCMKGDVVCAVQECGPTPLDKVNCTALPRSEGQCCTDTYECENMTDEELTTGSYDITTTGSISHDTVTPTAVDSAGTEQTTHKPTEVPEYDRVTEHGTVVNVPGLESTEPVDVAEKEDHEEPITDEGMTPMFDGHDESPEDELVAQGTALPPLVTESPGHVSYTDNEISPEVTELPAVTEYVPLHEDQLPEHHVTESGKPEEPTTITPVIEVTEKESEPLPSHDQVEGDKEGPATESPTIEHDKEGTEKIPIPEEPTTLPHVPGPEEGQGTELPSGPVSPPILEEGESTEIPQVLPSQKPEESATTEVSVHVPEQQTEEEITEKESGVTEQPSHLPEEKPESDVGESTAHPTPQGPSEVPHGTEEPVTLTVPEEGEPATVAFLPGSTEAPQYVPESKPVESEEDTELPEVETELPIKPSEGTESPSAIPERTEVPADVSGLPHDLSSEKPQEEPTEVTGLPAHVTEISEGAEVTEVPERVPEHVTEVREGAEVTEVPERVPEHVTEVREGAEVTEVPERVPEHVTEVREGAEVTEVPEGVPAHVTEVGEDAEVTDHPEVIHDLPDHTVESDHPEEQTEESPTVSHKEPEEGTTTPSGSLPELPVRIGEDESELTEEPEHGGEKGVTTGVPAGTTGEPEGTEQPIEIPTHDEHEGQLPDGEDDRVIPGEGSCLVDGQTYKNNSEVPPMNHCQISCKCISSIMQCESVACEPPPSHMQNCMPVYHGPDSCCATYSCTMPAVTSMESDSHKMEETTKPMESESPVTIPISILPNEATSSVSTEKIGVSSVSTEETITVTPSHGEGVTELGHVTITDEPLESGPGAGEEQPEEEGEVPTHDEGESTEPSKEQEGEDEVQDNEIEGVVPTEPSQVPIEEGVRPTEGGETIKPTEQVPEKSTDQPPVDEGETAKPTEQPLFDGEDIQPSQATPVDVEEGAKPIEHPSLEEETPKPTEQVPVEGEVQPTDGTPVDEAVEPIHEVLFDEESAKSTEAAPSEEVTGKPTEQAPVDGELAQPTVVTPVEAEEGVEPTEVTLTEGETARPVHEEEVVPTQAAPVDVDDAVEPTESVSVEEETVKPTEQVPAHGETQPTEATLVEIEEGTKPTEHAPSEGETATEQVQFDGEVIQPTDAAPVEEGSKPTEHGPFEEETAQPTVKVPVDGEGAKPTEVTLVEEDEDAKPTEQVLLDGEGVQPTDATPVDGNVKPTEHVPIEGETAKPTDEVPTEEETKPTVHLPVEGGSTELPAEGETGAPFISHVEEPFATELPQGTELPATTHKPSEPTSEEGVPFELPPRHDDIQSPESEIEATTPEGAVLMTSAPISPSDDGTTESGLTEDEEESVTTGVQKEPEVATEKQPLGGEKEKPQEVVTSEPVTEVLEEHVTHEGHIEHDEQPENEIDSGTGGEGEKATEKPGTEVPQAVAEGVTESQKEMEKPIESVTEYGPESVTKKEHEQPQQVPGEQSVVVISEGVTEQIKPEEPVTPPAIEVTEEPTEISPERDESVTHAAEEPEVVITERVVTVTPAGATGEPEGFSETTQEGVTERVSEPSVTEKQPESEAHVTEKIDENVIPCDGISCEKPAEKPQDEVVPCEGASCGQDVPGEGVISCPEGSQCDEVPAQPEKQPPCEGTSCEQGIPAPEPPCTGDSCIAVFTKPDEGAVPCPEGASCDQGVTHPEKQPEDDGIYFPCEGSSCELDTPAPEHVAPCTGDSCVEVVTKQPEESPVLCPEGASCEQPPVPGVLPCAGDSCDQNAFVPEKPSEESGAIPCSGSTCDQGPAGPEKPSEEGTPVPCEGESCAQKTTEVPEIVHVTESAEETSETEKQPEGESHITEQPSEEGAPGCAGATCDQGAEIVTESHKEEVTEPHIIVQPVTEPQIPVQAVTEPAVTELHIPVEAVTEPHVPVNVVTEQQEEVTTEKQPERDEGVTVQLGDVTEITEIPSHPTEGETEKHPVEGVTESKPEEGVTEAIGTVTEVSPSKPESEGETEKIPTESGTEKVPAHDDIEQLEEHVTESESTEEHTEKVPSESVTEPKPTEVPTKGPSVDVTEIAKETDDEVPEKEGSTIKPLEGIPEGTLRPETPEVPEIQSTSVPSESDSVTIPPSHDGDVPQVTEGATDSEQTSAPVTILPFDDGEVTEGVTEAGQTAAPGSPAVPPRVGEIPVITDGQQTAAPEVPAFTSLPPHGDEVPAVTEGEQTAATSLPTVTSLPPDVGEATEGVTEAEQTVAPELPVFTSLPPHDGQVPVITEGEQTSPPELPAVTVLPQVSEEDKITEQSPVASQTEKEGETPKLPASPEEAEKIVTVLPDVTEVSEPTTEQVVVITSRPPTPVVTEGIPELPTVVLPVENATEFLSSLRPTNETERPSIPGEGLEPTEAAFTSPAGFETSTPFTSGPVGENVTTIRSVSGELSTSATLSTSTEILVTTLKPVVTTLLQSTPEQEPDEATLPTHDHLPGQEPDYQTPVEEDYGEEEPGAFGPGTCRYGGKVYVSAQQIPRDDPCDFCFCFRSDIICLQQSCPPPIPKCHDEPIRGFCCPRYECVVNMATSVNISTTTTTTTTTLPPHFLSHAYKGRATKTGCLIQNKAYQVGEEIESASGPCLHCTCGGNGQMKCDPKACSPEPMIKQMIAAAASRKRR